jgi:hypothetical protein
MWRRSRTIPCARRKGGVRIHIAYVGNGRGWKCVCESSKVALRPRKAAIKMMDHESHVAKRCNQHPSNIHHHQQGWGGEREAGLVGGAMVRCMGAPYLPNWGRVQSSLSLSVFLFRFGNRVPDAMPDYNQGTTCSLVRRVHRGVAGSTDGRKLLYPSEYFSGGA